MKFTANIFWKTKIFSVAFISLQPMMLIMLY